MSVAARPHDRGDCMANHVLEEEDKALYTMTVDADVCLVCCIEAKVLPRCLRLSADTKSS